MTTNEITSTARRKVLEETNDIVTDTVLLLYANEAYKDVWKKAVSANEVTTTPIACANGVCTLPADFGRFYTTATDQFNRVFTEYSIADFNRNEFDNGMAVEGGVLKVSQNDVTTLVIKYYPQPETLTALVNPSIDPYFHEPIVYGIMWRVYEDLQDEELSTFFFNKFNSELDRKMQTQSNYEEANQRGGQMFTHQRLI